MRQLFSTGYRVISSRAAVVLAVPLLLAACATAGSSRYYSLQPAAVLSRSASDRSSGTGAGYAVGVQPVGVPAQVDRPQIVLNGRDDASVMLLNGSLWASPLTDEIRLAVSSHLARLLDVPTISPSEASGKLPVWRVSLNFQRFDSVYNQRAVVAVNWRITPPEKSGVGSAVLCSATASAGASELGVPGLVQAHRQILAGLSSVVAAQISALRAGRSAELSTIKGQIPEGVAINSSSCAAL